MAREQLAKHSSPASPPGTVGYAVLTYTASATLASPIPTGSARSVSCTSSEALGLRLIDLWPPDPVAFPSTGARTVGFEGFLDAISVACSALERRTLAQPSGPGCRSKSPPRAEVYEVTSLQDQVTSLTTESRSNRSSSDPVRSDFSGLVRLHRRSRLRGKRGRSRS